MKLIYIFFILVGIQLINAKLVMVIRHGEKISDKYSGLSSKGQARADCLIEAFGSNGIYVSPQKIYAQSTEGKKSTRPRDTVIPLASNLELNIDLSFRSDDVKRLAKQIKNSPEEVVLVSWSRDKIDNFAKQFGIKNVSSWDNNTFDEIWMITDGVSNYNKSTRNSVKPIKTYRGKEGFNIEVVKENIDECINRITPLYLK